MGKEVDSIQHLIENRLIEYKEKVVCAHKKGYRTYTATGQELHEKVNSLRTFFRKHNVKKGDKVILLGMSSIEWVAAYFASILSGIIVVPLDTLTDKTLLKKIQLQVHAKIIFEDRGLAEIGVTTIYFDEFGELFEKNKGHHLDVVHVDPQDILEIQYTSGTTGEPKGVVLTHENIAAGTDASVKSVHLKLHLRILNLLPLSHVFGQIAGIFFCLYFGHAVYFLDSIQPRKIISFIKNKRINAAILVPGILAALKHELEGKSLARELGLQFRVIGVGGAPLDPELERWWKRHLIIVLQGYGLTETAAIVTVNKPFMTRTGSVGMIAEGVDVMFGPDDEIVVRGKGITSGYYKNEEKTKQSFENGWFKTGDVGEIKNGYLYMKERKKDVIITGTGLKAYPVDIEEVLNKIEGVKDSCVIERNGKIHAVLLLKDDDAPLIIRKANAKLLGHQKIGGYSIWPESDFPRTPTGKARKFMVKQGLGRIKGAKQHYQNKVYSILRDILSPSHTIIANSKLVDIGMDSLKRVELISELENEFGIEIDETKLNQELTVSHLERMMKKEKIQRLAFKTWPLHPIIKAIRPLVRLVNDAIIGMFAKVSYHGIENIRDIKDPVIFAANHQSAWDGPVIMRKIEQKLAVPADAKVVFGIGDKNLIFTTIYKSFTGFYTSAFYNAYAFGPDIGTDLSLEFTGEMIDRGYSILIFPEATRTPDGEIHEFLPGVGYMAATMELPVIPVKIEGLYNVLPRGKMIPRSGNVNVTFGKPFIVKDISYREATRRIEKKVKEL